MKKPVSLLLCLVMVLSLLSFSGALAADATVVTMLYSDNANYPLKNDWMVFQIIEEKCGVTFDIISVPESDYAVKTQTILNSGDLPDILTKTNPSSEMIESGLLLPISKYADQMPNYTAYLEKYGVDKNMDMYRQADGEYYFLPIKALTEPQQEQQWLVRYDVFQANDIPIPTTLDELAQALRTLKELYPDSVGITNRFGTGNLLRSLGPAFGISAGWNLGQGVGFNKADETWYFTPTSQGYKDMLIYLNGLYNDGTLDPEWATLDTAVYEQYIVQGKTFVMVDWTQNKVRYNAAGVANNPDYYVGPVYPLTGYEGNYALGEVNMFTQYWALSAAVADKPYFDKVLAFIDWCYTDEAEMLLTFGIEGETYQLNDSGHYEFIDPNNVDYSAQYGLVNNCLDMRQHKDVILSTLLPDEAALFSQIAADGCIRLPNPTCPLSDTDVEEMSLISNNVLDYVNQSLLKFITGDLSLETEWDAYVAQCESLGSTRMVEIYQNAWTR